MRKGWLTGFLFMCCWLFSSCHKDAVSGYALAVKAKLNGNTVVWDQQVQASAAPVSGHDSYISLSALRDTTDIRITIHLGNTEDIRPGTYPLRSRDAWHCVFEDGHQGFSAGMNYQSGQFEGDGTLTIIEVSPTSIRGQFQVTTGTVNGVSQTLSEGEFYAVRK